MPRAIVSWLVGLAILVSVGSAANADQVPRIRLREVKPLVLVLNPKPNVIERHVGLQAHVDADPNTEQQALVAAAERLFEDKLRVLLERDAAFNIAFVTFYMGAAVIHGQQATRTFRVVFQLKEGKWIRL